MEFNISTELGGNVVVIDMVGSLVANNIAEFKSQVAKLVEKKYCHILLEMSNVDFMDSSGLGACMAVHKQLSEKNGMVVFAKPSEQVKKIFRITKADQRLNVVPTKNDGVKSLYEKLMRSKQK
ncbi:MAG: STAS domain-containing protein [Desulfobacterales bacterium]|nr:STAS domain-containing protein [Desulfobacterales bacterium]